MPLKSSKMIRREKNIRPLQKHPSAACEAKPRNLLHNQTRGSHQAEKNREIKSCHLGGMSLRARTMYTGRRRRECLPVKKSMPVRRPCRRNQAALAIPLSMLENRASCQPLHAEIKPHRASLTAINE